MLLAAVAAHNQHNTMKLTLIIEMDNAAFEDGAEGTSEVSRILKEYADSLNDNSFRDKGLYDINGNKVGKVSVQ